MKFSLLITHFLLCLLGVIVLPFIVLFGVINPSELSASQLNSLVCVIIACSISSVVLFYMSSYPGERSGLGILPANIFGFAIPLSVILILHLHYSVYYIVTAHILNIICDYFFFFLQRKFKRPTLLFIPSKKTEDIYKIRSVNWIRLDKPELPTEHFDSIVVDLRSPHLTDEWQKFLADATLKGIPVNNIKQIEESLTGRVKIHHMYENELGSLLPNPFYLYIKQCLESLLIIATLPITLPIMFITAIFIKLESKGSVLFTQKRVGQRGREFTIFKFRSMCQNSEEQGDQFAQKNDIRITKTGKFIRKTRIDELPQFFNVLLGDMSLIGPRPEQKSFVEEFEKTIPFYNYRHIVKPGISGWAQVTQGYAADTEETQIKVEHDFYYIKHFSLSLDVLIFFKTIKTMLTGFGAR